MRDLLMGFVGDVHVSRDNPQEVFSEVLEVLNVPGVLFGNLEGAYTNDPTLASNALIASANNLDTYAAAGFHVMSLANNHMADAGYEAMLQTRSRLRSLGVKTCGAGACLADAREPAVVEVHGLRIAFLGYASTFPVGWQAESNKPGLAPMRATNSLCCPGYFCQCRAPGALWHEQFADYYQPGTRPLVATVPDQIDVANLTEDIQRARQCADLVVTSFHWGDPTRRFHLTDHEIRTAKHCIDHGANMVVGHHHHSLRGMEWYKGKPIMYGLGHFAFDHRSAQVEDARVTLMAWTTAGRDGIRDIGFLPCRLVPDGSVHPLRLNSLESNEVVSYLEKCNGSQGLNSCIVSHGAISIAGFPTLRVTSAYRHSPGP